MRDRTDSFAQRVARINVFNEHVELATLERRELEETLDQIEQALARVPNVREIVPLAVRQGPGDPFLQDRDVAEHRGKWRSKLVRHVCEELVLEAPCLDHCGVLA